MHNTTRHPTWSRARARGLAALLGAIVLLGAGCGGKDAKPEAANRGGAGASLGSADGTLAGAPATTVPTRRPDGDGPTNATSTPAVAAQNVPSPARAATPSSSARAAATPSTASGARAAAATPHPDTPDPCTLVTAAEAETALGGRPFPASMRRSRDSAEVRCTYDYFANGEIGSVVVALWKGSEAKPVYDLRRSAYGQGATIEELRGLGDRAFTVKGDEGWINILKGDLYISIQVERQGLSAQDTRNRAMTLARTVLGRL